jgi:hypothetical protein
MYSQEFPYHTTYILGEDNKYHRAKVLHCAKVLITQRCCSNADHLENFKSDSYETDIQDAVDSHNQLLDIWASEQDMT